MKTQLTLLALLISILAMAQNGINYKAVINDTNGNVVANSLIAIQFNILVTADQILVYEEVHTPTTDDDGLVILNIGEGISSVNFSDLPWDYGDYFLNVQIDLGGGYVDMGTTQFKYVPFAFQADRATVADEALNLTGLERIEEVNNSWGWRLIGRNPDRYGSIGNNSVDLSENDSNSEIHGATGGSSFATGFRTIASSSFTTAMGTATEATAFAATSMGRVTLASGQSSTAMGNNTIASGNNSTSMGLFSIAAGLNATAMGYRSEAIGEHSIAMGFGTEAVAYCSTVIGRYNIGSGNQSNWVSSNQLFVIGNGSSINNRHNAVTVLKNGNVGIGTNSPNEALQINGRLRIGTETIEDSGNNELSFNAHLLPDNDGVFRLGNSQNRWWSVWATDGTINTSDRRSKTNIESLNYGLKDVMKLNPVSFNWKTNPNDDTKLGLIAQDLLKVIPEVVKTHDWETDENGDKIKKELERMGVYYSDLVPVLIKAIQEQQQIIDLQSSNYYSLLERIEILETNTSN